MLLRPIHVEDIEYFSKWWRDPELRALTSGDFSELSDADINTYFKDLLSSPNRMDYMLEAEGCTIGHVTLAKREKDWWETQIVIGDKEYWGKGYGSKAISELVKMAHDRGITKIFLEVRPDNTRAIHAYEKAGFIQTGTIQYPHNTQLPITVRMEHIS